MTLPDLCVVDSNVIGTANGSNPEAGVSCAAASARALQHVYSVARICIDHGWLILNEYKAHLAAKGEPREGHKFVKWVLTNLANDARVTRVQITPKAHDATDFEELPMAHDGATYDSSDRKFLAVAAAHPERPHILQSFDSKWWGWQASLAKCGVTIHFLCPTEIQKKHAEKMGR